MIFKLQIHGWFFQFYLLLEISGISNCFFKLKYEPQLESCINRWQEAGRVPEHNSLNYCYSFTPGLSYRSLKYTTKIIFKIFVLLSNFNNCLYHQHFALYLLFTFLLPVVGTVHLVIQIGNVVITVDILVPIP